MRKSDEKVKVDFPLSSLPNVDMGAPGGVEPPTNGLGNRCSIHLSYGAIRT